MGVNFIFSFPVLVEFVKSVNVKGVLNGVNFTPAGG